MATLSKVEISQKPDEKPSVLKALVGVYEVTLEKDIPLTETVKKIKEYIRQVGLPVPLKHEVNWIWEDKRGSFTKRLKKFWEKKGITRVPNYSWDQIYGRTYQDRFLASIGQQFQAGTIKAGTYYVSIQDGPFTKDIVDSGHPGGSCWLNRTVRVQKQSLRHYEAFHRLGGLCVLFYENAELKTPIARFWLAKVGANLVCFNGYYKKQGSVAHLGILKKALSLKTKQISLTSSLYINKKKGFFLYKNFAKVKDIKKAHLSLRRSS